MVELVARSVLPLRGSVDCEIEEGGRHPAMRKMREEDYNVATLTSILGVLAFYGAILAAHWVLAPDERGVRP